MSWKSVAWGVCALLFSTLSVAATWQGRMTANDAIDKAGMQRMLSQRILKAYCELGFDERGSSRQQLIHAVNLFDANLLQLEGFLAADAAKSGLAKVREAWTPYRALALMPPSVEGARQLLEINHHLLSVTHETVVNMEQSLGTASGRQVNIAGRQRMLSQRLAMFYLLRLWGVGGSAEAALADTAAQEYAAALKELRAFGGNSVEAIALLDNLERAYRLLIKVRSNKTGNLSFMIATTSERMLNDADQLTRLYVGLDRK